MHAFEYGISIKDDLSVVDNDLPDNQYLVAQRQNDQTVKLTDGQSLETNLQVRHIA